MCVFMCVFGLGEISVVCGDRTPAARSSTSLLICVIVFLKESVSFVGVELQRQGRQFVPEQMAFIASANTTTANATYRCMYVYIYIHTYINTYIHIYTHIHGHAHNLEQIEFADYVILIHR